MHSTPHKKSQTAIGLGFLFFSLLGAGLCAFKVLPHSPLTLGLLATALILSALLCLSSPTPHALKTVYFPIDRSTALLTAVLFQIGGLFLLLAQPEGSGLIGPSLITLGTLLIPLAWRAPERARQTSPREMTPNFQETGCLLKQIWKTHWAGICIVTLAFCLGSYNIDIRFPHGDEGNNATLAESLLNKTNRYTYIAEAYHGPLHFYFLAGAAALFGDGDIRVYRMLTVTLFCICASLMLCFEPYFGRKTARLAALATALSPGFIYHGRYSIHEMWLVLFLMLTYLGVLNLWVRKEKKGLWLLCWGVAGCILTKETFIIHLGALAAALGLLPLINLCSKTYPPSVTPPRQWAWKDTLAPILTALLAVAYFYTGGFLDSKPLIELFQGASSWTLQGTNRDHGQVGHMVHPLLYFYNILLKYEWMGVVGLLVCIKSAFPCTPIVRLTAVWTFGVFLAYTLIPYKTPWCIISFLWALILLSAHGFIKSLEATQKTHKQTHTLILCALIITILHGVATALPLNYSIDPRTSAWDHYKTLLKEGSFKKTPSPPGGGTNYNFVNLGHDWKEPIAAIKKEASGKDTLGLYIDPVDAYRHTQPLYWLLPAHLTTPAEFLYKGTKVNHIEPGDYLLDGIALYSRVLPNQEHLYPEHILEEDSYKIPIAFLGSKGYAFLKKNKYKEFLNREYPTIKPPLNSPPNQEILENLLPNPTLPHALRWMSSRTIPATYPSSNFPKNFDAVTISTPQNAYLQEVARKKITPKDSPIQLAENPIKPKGTPTRFSESPQEKAIESLTRKTILDQTRHPEKWITPTGKPAPLQLDFIKNTKDFRINTFKNKKQGLLVATKDSLTYLFPKHQQATLEETLQQIKDTQPAPFRLYQFDIETIRSDGKTWIERNSSKQ